MELKLKKCRTCNGCRGYFISNGHCECQCGWELEFCGMTPKPFDLPIYRPRGGLCYKPKTYDEYFEANNLNRGRSLEMVKAAQER